MIVTCPECSTRYLVDPRALGATGRVVRCASCSHTWHQAAPDDAPRRVDLAPPEIDPARDAPGRIQLPALPPTPRRSLSAVSGILFVVVVLGLGIAGLWAARDQVVGYWPSAARFYTMLGIAVAEGPGELELDKIMTTRDSENGLPTLVIQGEVVNVSKVAHDVPKLRVILQDNNKHELQSWSFSVTDERLLPGATAPFRTSISQPSEAASQVVVTFDVGS
jgi:predicted Zn finger-like uncharacterized protein